MPSANAAGQPTISGTPQEGQILTEGPGTWLTGGTFTMQWLRCDSSGQHCVPIGVPIPPGSSYQVQAVDVGSTIKVRETNADNGKSKPSIATPVVAPASPPPPVPPAIQKAPVNQTLPSIAGTARPGQTLVESDGTWSNNPRSFVRQWIRCEPSGQCAAIAGASGSSYTLTGADAGGTFEVHVTAHNGSLQGSATSDPFGPVAPNTSSTSLLAAPSSGVVTNQPTTLTATISSSSGSTPPAGTVTFTNAGSPIGGCANVPVSTVTASVTVTCKAGFSAATSPQQLTAVFAPGGGSGLSGSTSPVIGLGVGKDPTSTALDVSNPTVGIGTTATYTATVSAKDAGGYRPSGSVQFLDNGKAIAACTSVKLTHNQAAMSAQCTVLYSKVGRHGITAKYFGDAGFTGSSSSAVQVSVTRLPPGVRGVISSKTRWVFLYTPTYAKVLSLVVHQAPAGMTILVRCRGRGCPSAAWSTAVATPTRCTRTKGHRCAVPKSRNVDLSQRFRGRRLRPGTVVTVELVRTQWIGKEYVFSTRAARPPRVQILCVSPNARRPGVGCSLH